LPAIAANPAALKHAAVLGCVKDKPCGRVLKKHASLTHPARGGLYFVHGRGEGMASRPNKGMPALGSEGG
jgi:hypothetical protein